MTLKNIPDPKSINLQKDDLSQLSDVDRSVAMESARLQLETRSQGGCRAYLASLELIDDDPADIQESLEELGSLVRSLGDECMGVMVQKRSKITPGTFIGVGKAEELKASARELKVDYVVFDRDLSPSQVRNLEKIIERPVLDRTGIILQIFRKNAKTREARTMVEIAHLDYLAPRLANAWVTFERQRGGSGGAGSRVKGAGETQLEMDRRKVKEKISNLRKELEKIQKERETQRKQRNEEFSVVLVGYTNAGKTTVMNALTDSQLSAKNALFETLDSSVRTLKGLAAPKILITDTVGFIRNLPHGLVASFRSTLEEASRADLLLHIVDLSQRHYKDHMQVTEDVLKEIGASDVPRMIVFNKVDELKSEPRLARILARTYPGSIALSAQNEADGQRLRECIVEYFSRNMVEKTLHVSYDDAKTMNLVRTQTRVLEVKWNEDGAIFHIRAPLSIMQRYFESPKTTETPEEVDSNLPENPWKSGEFSFDSDAPSTSQSSPSSQSKTDKKSDKPRAGDFSLPRNETP